MSYIVVDSDGEPMLLGTYGDTPKTGVLTSHGRQATVFPHYSAARYAIDRSRVYAHRNRLTWPTDRFVIVRLVPPQKFE